MVDFKNDSNYIQVFYSKVHNKAFYAPAQSSDYHISRYVAGGAQNIYSASGITKELNEKLLNHILELVNSDKKVETFRTDIGVIVNNLKYRMKYPVDEDCAIRMGAIYSFMDGEDPNQVNANITENKVRMAKGTQDMQADPDLYAFFLTMGIMYTPSWKELDKDSINTDYFRKRMEALNALTPQ